MKHFIILVLILTCGKVSSQTRYDSFSLNLSGFVFNDFSAYYEITGDSGKVRKGISLGYMISNNWWRGELGTTHGFEFNDDITPVGAYNGPQLRLYYLLLKKYKGKERFRGPQILIKYLYYNDYTFADFFPGLGEKAPVFFKRDERTIVLGTEWIWGTTNLSRNGRNFTQVFWGIGGRVKFRSINTLSSYSYEGFSFAENHRPTGSKKDILIIPTINFGFKFGSFIRRPDNPVVFEQHDYVQKEKSKSGDKQGKRNLRVRIKTSEDVHKARLCNFTDSSIIVYSKRWVEETDFTDTIHYSDIESIGMHPRGRGFMGLCTGLIVGGLTGKSEFACIGGIVGLVAGSSNWTRFEVMNNYHAFEQARIHLSERLFLRKR